MHTNPYDGEGANLIAVAEMLGLNSDQVVFSTERLASEQLAELYNISDVTMNISNNEGFGLSCLESLSCGTPVIINKTGGLQDQAITDEGVELGVVVPPATKSLTGSQQIPYIFDDRCADEDLIEALKKMQNMSSEERRKLGSEAQEWARKSFSLKNLVEKWDNALTRYITRFKEKGYENRIRFKKV